MMAQRLLGMEPMRRVVLALALWLSAPAAHAADFARSLRPDAGAALHIELERGDVEVVTHAGRELRLEGEARGVGASAVHFALRDAGGGRLVFESRAEGWLAWLSSGPRVRVRALVPRDLALSVATPGRVVASEAGVQAPLPARLDLAARTP
jgi:hypothetical protein